MELNRSQRVSVLLVLLLVAPAIAEAQNNKKKKRKSQAPEQVTEAAESFSEIDSALRAWNLERAASLLAKTGDSHRARARQAWLEALRGHYGKAEERLTNLTQQNGGDAEAWAMLGEVRLMREQMGPANAAFERAEREAQAATGRKADDGDAWLYLGIARQRLKKYDPAADALRKARQNGADPTEVLYQLGRTFAFKEDWRAAVDALDSALDRQRDLAYAYFYRGVAHRRLEENGRMVEDLERFLALAPDAPDAERARRLLEAARR